MIGAVVAAVVFGLFVGYLALSNDSFPSKVKPFSEYASVTSSTFNGTEFAFDVRWGSSSFLPLYAQLTSPTTDAANTPVCGTGLSSVSSGQVIFLPFAIRPASPTLTNVDLSIAVKSLVNGTEFTIVYNVPSVNAGNAHITPPNISCGQHGS